VVGLRGIDKLKVVPFTAEDIGNPCPGGRLPLAEGNGVWERTRLWPLALLFVLAAVLYLGYRHEWSRSSFRDRFEQVRAGMSDEQVRAVMGAPGNRKSDWRPQVSQYAEVGQRKEGAFARREYHGLDVHTEVGLSGTRHLVWKTDEAVVIVEFDRDDRVCGKIWLTE
jgi:hypothetical protein